MKQKLLILFSVLYLNVTAQEIFNIEAYKICNSIWVTQSGTATISKDEIKLNYIGKSNKPFETKLLLNIPSLKVSKSDSITAFCWKSTSILKTEIRESTTILMKGKPHDAMLLYVYYSEELFTIHAIR